MNNVVTVLTERHMPHSGEHLIPLTPSIEQTNPVLTLMPQSNHSWGSNELLNDHTNVEDTKLVLNRKFICEEHMWHPLFTYLLVDLQRLISPSKKRRRGSAELMRLARYTSQSMIQVSIDILLILKF